MTKKSHFLLRNIFILLLFLTGIRPSIISQELRQINIEIAQDSIEELESHPFTNGDVHGNFVSDDLRFDDIEIHYRGAYYLNTLINKYKQRNLKIKTSKTNRYLDRREWNFNFEQHIRQKFAYHLMEKAGVKVISTEHVKLSVNGDYHGLYLKYEDPDNKNWLRDAFGSDEGDLYKAAYDMPGETKYFADLTILGDKDEDYFLHYRKQTNNNDAEEFNYQSIMNFIQVINTTPDRIFDQAIGQYFAVGEFLSYLIVTNFISNWDSYPQRPKNFWLYENPADGLWHYIPWDMDGTFQSDGMRNSYGLDASVLHYLDHFEDFPLVSNETKERPLVWRIMDVDAFRNKYLRMYQDAVGSYLSKESLFHDLDSLADQINNNISGTEKASFNNSVSKTKSFIQDKFVNVSAELAQYDFNSMGDIFSDNSIILFPTIATDHFFIRPSKSMTIKSLKIYNQTGRVFYNSETEISLEPMQLLKTKISEIESGIYLVDLQLDSGAIQKKLIVQ